MSVVVSAVRGPGRGWSYLFTATTLSPDATTVPNRDCFRWSGRKLFPGQKMRAAPGVRTNGAHGCIEIDTLLQVATLGCLNDAVRNVVHSQPAGSMTNEIGRRSDGAERHLSAEVASGQQVACQWIGNSQPIAATHYLQGPMSTTQKRCSSPPFSFVPGRSPG